jgi:hypothetical protein
MASRAPVGNRRIWPAGYQPPQDAIMPHKYYVIDHVERPSTN